MNLTLVLLLVGIPAALAADYEQRAVAAVLMGEARNQGSNGMVAVMEVIHQRASERQNTLWGTINQPKSFSCLSNTSIDTLIRKYEKDPAYKDALRIAQMNRGQMPGITRHANHYHYTHKEESPPGKKPVAVVKDRSFYRLERR